MNIKYNIIENIDTNLDLKKIINKKIVNIMILNEK